MSEIPKRAIKCEKFLINSKFSEDIFEKAKNTLKQDFNPIDDMRASFVERRNIMVKRLNTIPGISCLTPQGAFYAFPNISGLFGKVSSSGPITDSVLFCKYFLKEKLVACVPGSGFGAEGYIRLSYATSMDAIQTALDKLEEWVNTLS